jgi:curved DNA-binding protein
MALKDYYQLLGVSSDAPEEEIKKAYRKLALATHPDRNRQDPMAEERFKEINEAYGVLGDPGKRAQYDDHRRFGYSGSGSGTDYAGPGFGYSQEEILRDFFRSRQSHDVFSELHKEFQRSGFRFDESFINNLFFGGQTIFFQGVVWTNSQGPRLFRFGDLKGKPNLHQTEGRNASTMDQDRPRGLLAGGLSLLAKAGKRIGGYLLNKALGLPSSSQLPGLSTGLGRRPASDLTYNLAISADQAVSGGKILVDLSHLAGGRKVSVNIPAGVKTGTRLRLKNLGEHLDDGIDRRGDVYLELRVD